MTVRGTVTIMSTDLVASTELLARLGDDEGERLLRSHLRRLREVIARHHGGQIQSRGDGLLASFGGASDAVRCAVAIQHLIHRHNSSGGEPLQVRIGLHAGEAAIDVEDFYGTPVVVASRLCDAAGGGEIFASGVLRSLVGSRGTFSFEPVGDLALKGVDEPVPTWRVGWDPPGVDEVERSDEPSSTGSRRLAFVIGGTLVLAAAAAGVFALVRDAPPPAQRPPGSIRLIARPSLDETDAFAAAIAGNGELVALTALEDRGPGDARFQVSVAGPAAGDVELASAGAGSDRPGNRSSREVSVSYSGDAVSFSSDASDLVAGDNNEATDVFVRLADETLRVSVASDGTEADGPSFDPALSANGRFVAFSSRASNLAAKGDTNGVADIFVRDLQRGRTQRVSLGTRGAEGNKGSFAPSISGDGRYVAFASAASNLVAGDSNGATDIFVYDRDLQLLERVSVASDNAQAKGASARPDISADGRSVVFESFASNLVVDDTNGDQDVFIHELAGGGTTRVSVGSEGGEADGPSSTPAVTREGRFVVFSSEATNLVPGDTNAAEFLTGRDVFVRDLVEGRTVRVSATSTGGDSNGRSFEPDISADGTAIVFLSEASNLVTSDEDEAVDVFLWSRS